MTNEELNQVAVEMNCIFDNLDKETLKKIPISFRNFFGDFSSENTTFKYDITKKLSNQNLSPKTKGMLAFIYRNYLCTEIEKKQYDMTYKIKLKELEEKKKELYNIDNIFEKRKSKIKYEYEENLPTLYSPEPFYKKLLNKLINLFKKR